MKTLVAVIMTIACLAATPASAKGWNTKAFWDHQSRWSY